MKNMIQVKKPAGQAGHDQTGHKSHKTHRERSNIDEVNLNNRHSSFKKQNLSFKLK